MSLNTDSLQRHKPMHRDLDSARLRIPSNDSHLLNLPPPPVPLSSTMSTHSIRPPSLVGSFNILPPPPSSTLADTLSTFNKERLHDVLQHGLGSYVFIDHFGLVPKLNHF